MKKFPLIETLNTAKLFQTYEIEFDGCLYEVDIPLTKKTTFEAELENVVTMGQLEESLKKVNGTVKQK